MAKFVMQHGINESSLSGADSRVEVLLTCPVHSNSEVLLLIFRVGWW